MRRCLPFYINGLRGPILLVLFLLCTVPALQAQNDSDTLIATDPEQVSPPPDEAYSEDNDDETTRQRFNPLQEEEAFRVQERKLPSDYAERLKKDDDFWYADAELKKEEKKKKQKEAKYNPDYVPLMRQPWVQTLLWIIIVGGFAFAVLWYLMDNNVGLFRRKNVKTDAADSGTEEMPEDIFAIQYQKEIDKALAQGNYRLAIRVQFLQLLRTLADKQLIQYKQEKTNLDYLMELSSKTWYPVFFRLTRHFEYSWYGHFEVGADAYRLIAAEFNQLQKQV